MSIVNNLLSSDFSKYINQVRFVPKETSHLPTKYESNVTEAMHSFCNFIWHGKDGNTSSTDAITKGFKALEIKGSESVGEQQLNSTPLCRFTKYIELPDDTQKALSKLTKKSISQLRYWVFPKEYLFIIKKMKVAIYIDPKIIPDSYYTYTDSNIELLEYFKNGHECEANKNNKIAQNNNFKNKLTLENKEDNFITLRLRAMFSFSLSQLLNNSKYSLNKKLLSDAACIAFISTQNFHKENLTNLTNLIHYQDDNLIILVNKK